MDQKNQEIAFENATTPAERLKIARNMKGFSRKELAALTDIPEKSIEKYEYGSMEPNISRLHTLCKALDLTSETVIGINGKPVENSDTNDNFSRYFRNSREHLYELDRMRNVGFSTASVKAKAHFEALESSLCFLDTDELEALAAEQEVTFEGLENETVSQLHIRILDKALFGVDLHSIEYDALVKLANEYDLSPSDRPFWWDWEGHSEVAKEIRGKFQQDLFENTEVPDFQDQEQFPQKVSGF